MARIDDFVKSRWEEMGCAGPEAARQAAADPSPIPTPPEPLAGPSSPGNSVRELSLAFMALAFAAERVSKALEAMEQMR